MRLFVIFVLGISLSAAEDKARQLPEGPGRATAQRLCGACHGYGNFVRRRETRDGWNAVIEEMIRRGAKGEEEEWAEVSDYLVANFSPVRVNVNSATPEAIVNALLVKPEHAAAIVKYREANGPFKSIDDLKKVEGLPASAIESNRERIDF